MDDNSYIKDGLTVIERLIVEVKDVNEEEFDRWYEKKKKVFNIGAKRKPTKEEFIKYLNYAASLYSAGDTPSIHI